MKLRLLCAAVAVFYASTAPGAEWRRYENGRYGYSIDMPGDFSAGRESDNGDSVTALSADGQAELRVWSGRTLDEGFPAEVKWRIGQDQAEGWRVGYHKLQTGWAVWSGAKGGRIFYERAISICGGAAAAFRLEYPAGRARAFDPVITHLAKSLRGC